MDPLLHDAAARAADHDDALALALRTLDDCERSAALPAWRVEAHAEVARCWRANGALDAAEQHLRRALAWAEALPGVDARVDLLCQLADLSAERHADARTHDRAAARRLREQAAEFAHEAVAQVRQAADAYWEVQVLLRASDALDDTGDHAEAIALQCRALNLLVQDELNTASASRSTAA
jgi:hypothetical protein